MAEPDRDLIERWVRNPDSLAPKVRQRIETHVQTDAEWGEVAAYWQRYYATLSETPELTDDQIWSRLAPPRPTARIYTLEALPDAAPPDEPSVRVLAAKSPRPTPALTTLAVFASPDDTLLVRCQHHVPSETLQVYVVPLVDPAPPVVLVQLPWLEAPLLISPERQAVVSTNALARPLETPADTITLRYPDATISVAERPDSSTHRSDRGLTVTIAPHAEGVAGYPDGGEAPLHGIGVRYDDGTLTYTPTPTAKAPAVVEAEDLPVLFYLFR